MTLGMTMSIYPFTDSKILKHKKAQSAVEIALIITFMLIVMNVFLILVTDKLVDQQTNRYRSMLQDLLDIVDSEVKLASTLEDGYQRSFNLLNDIRGREYSTETVNFFDKISGATSNSTEISFYFDDKPNDQLVTFLPGNVVGVVVKGTNTVRKEEGFVFMNCNDEDSQFDRGVCTNIQTDLFDFNCDDYLENIGVEGVFSCNVCCVLYNLCCPSD